MCLLLYRKREKEHGYGEESCTARRFPFAPPNCKPPPMLSCRWGSPVVVVVSRGLPSCIFALILQENAAALPVSVGIIVCNTNGNIFSCKFSCILDDSGAFPPVSHVFRQFSPVVAAVCQMVSAWNWRTCRRWGLSAVSCPARNMTRRATPLPSPLRCSFLIVSVSRWWSVACSAAPPLRLSCRGLWWSLLPCWWWLYGLLYYTVFNRARN